MNVKKVIKRVGYVVAALLAIVVIGGLILAFLPSKSKTNHIGISAERAVALRQSYKGAHDQFTTTDGATLFLWRWNPDTVVDAKKNIAVLIFHGITAYGGAYTMA